VENASVLKKLVEALRQDEVNGGYSRDKHIIEILKAHPFIRPMEPTVLNYPEHRFTIQGYGLHLSKFRKWLKNDGYKFKSVAGGVSDDGLYTVSPLLREVMPRGFHYIVATHKETSRTSTFVFRGIPKFTGLEEVDEDEKSNSYQNNFFFRGKSLADGAEAFETEKSNGENAKLGFATLDGVDYLVSGSKNIANIWPAEEPSEDYYPHMREIPASTIAMVYSKWYRSQCDEAKIIFKACMSRCGTIMGEINCPWREHVYPIKSLVLEVYSVLNKQGFPFSARDSWKVFQEIGLKPEGSTGLKHVRFVRFDIIELNERVKAVRARSGTEGSVFYVCDSAGETIGMCKVKTSEYVIQRRIRESTRSGLWNLLHRNEVRGYTHPSGKAMPKTRDMTADILPRLYERLSKGMRTLHHVPFCAELSGKWIEFAHGFVDFWFQTRLKKKKGCDIDVTDALIETNQSYGSLIAEYRAQHPLVVVLPKIVTPSVQYVYDDLDAKEAFRGLLFKFYKK